MVNPITTTYYFNACGQTSSAIDFIRSSIDLSKISKVTVLRTGVFALCKVEFTLVDDRIFVIDRCFSIGYISINSLALYRLLIEAGFPINDTYKLCHDEIKDFSICKKY